MKDGIYEIGTLVRFVDEASSDSGVHPAAGTIGKITRYFFGDPNIDTTGAIIEWPEGPTRQGGGNAYCSYRYLELVEDEAEEKNEEDGVLTCADCGCIIEDVEEARKRSDGRYICEDCAEDHYVTCECCGGLVIDLEAQIIDEEIVCDDCRDNPSSPYFYCTSCGEYHRERIGRSRIEIWTGEEICRECYAENYFTCDNCGEVHLWENAEEVDEEYLCPDCAREAHGRAIHDYNYKPEPVFKTAQDIFFNEDDAGELMFGVELEVDKGCDAEECAEELTDASEDIYCKRDRSLDCGIEIVSHPCSLEYHTKYLGWRRLAAIARKHEFLSHDAKTCGLHIHVGVRQLASTWEGKQKIRGKLVMLVDRHWDNIVKFSRRTEWQLGRWAGRPSFDVGYSAEKALQNAMNTYKEGRYQAVNITGDSTVEFRVFNGTLRVETLYAALQFVSNLCKYAMSHTAEEILASQWDDIIGVERFAELEEYLKMRGIVGEQLPEAKFEQQKQEIEFQVGDRVVIDSLPDCEIYLNAQIGLEGLVVGFSAGDVLIAFDSEDGNRWHYGDCMRKACGYWMPPGNLSLVERPEGYRRALILNYIRYLKEESESALVSDIGTMFMPAVEAEEAVALFA